MTKMTFQSARFGAIEYETQDVVTMPDGMIGFPEDHEFLVLAHREGSPFRWFQSLTNPALAFLIVQPAEMVADYGFTLNESVAAELELYEATPYLVYTVVNIPRGKPEEMTLNLAGPIVINAETRRAKQVVLEDSRFDLRHRVVPSQAPPKAA